MDVKKIEDGARQLYEGLLIIAQQIPNSTVRQNIEHLAGICEGSFDNHSPTLRKLAVSDPEYKEMQLIMARVASEYRAKLRQVICSGD